MASDPIAGRLAEAERDIVRLTHAVGTLITWMAQAANTPIRGEEAETLLNILHGVEPSIPELKR